MNKGIIAIIVGLVLVVGGYFALEQYSNYQATNAVKQRVDDLNEQSRQTIEYGEVSTSLFGGDLTISDVVFKNAQGNVQTSMESITLQSSNFNEALPNQMSVDISNMTPKAQLERRPQLAALLKDEPMDVSVSYQYNPQTKNLTSNMSTNVDTLAELSGSLNLGGMETTWNELKSASKEKRSVNFRQMGLQNVLLDNINLSMTDKGIVDKTLEEQAAQMRMDKEQLKERRLSQLQNNPQIPEQVASKLTTFLSESGKTLDISINPNDDVTLVRIPQLFLGQRDKQQFLEQFNVDINVD